MAERKQLREEDIDKVVGGAFNFYTNSAGQSMCYVDDSGFYCCTPDASSWVIQRTAGSSDSSTDVLAEAMALGIFWQ